VGVMPPIKYWEIVADKQLRLLCDKCAAFCQHDSNARESQGGAELIGISVEMLHDTAIPNIAPGSCFQSWSQTIRMI